MGENVKKPFLKGSALREMSRRDILKIAQHEVLGKVVEEFQSRRDD
jgi:hypothetical protein